MDLIHREMDCGRGYERLLDFDMSLFSSRAFREKLTQRSDELKHLKHKLCLVCFDQSRGCARFPSEPRTDERKKAKRKNTESRCRLSYGVIVFLDKEGNYAELCVSGSVLQMLTSHKTIKKVIVRTKSDLFFKVLMSCTAPCTPPKVVM